VSSSGKITGCFHHFRNFESPNIWSTGVIVDELCDTPSHWSSAKTLDSWLEENGVTGVCGIDTRRLTQQIREHGSMLGKIVVGMDAKPEEIEQLDPSKYNVVAKVSIKVLANKPPSSFRIDG
jgi:carbamoylphosphate synthase small subunit